MNVISLGTFDIGHTGHINLIKKCNLLAGIDGFVRIGLNTDEFIEQYKGKKPVMSYQERYNFIDALNLVDEIVPNSQPDGTIKDTLNDIDLIVVGSDWLRKDYLKQVGLTIDYLDENNIGLCYVTYTPNISTTEIKRRICQSA